LTGGELENACTLTAQRLGLLNELSAPEFFDKALFRGFIQKLRERKVVWTDENGKLDYDRALEDLVRDSRVILSREVRHSILKITPGGDREPTAVLPDDASASDLHQRHVDTEQQEHERRAGIDRRQGEAAKQEPARRDGAE
jgi:glycerol-3-phosphate O-acyltransferase